VDEPLSLLDEELVVDVHFHVGASAARYPARPRFAFEKPAISDGYAAYLSPRILGKPLWRLLGRVLGLPTFKPGDELDRAMESITLRHFDQAPSVDRAVALAFDQYHTDDGHPVGPAVQAGDLASDLFVSNSFVWEFCRRHPGRFFFGASIHPYRARALEALEEVTAVGAVLVKWLPVVQNIDITDARSVAFLRRAAQLHVPLLIHYGGEKTLATAHPEFTKPGPLFEVLDKLWTGGCCPTVIIAHVAVGTNWPAGLRGFIRETIAALSGPFRDRPVYADTSAGAVFTRAHWLKRLARMPQLHDKLVFGTDFPVPPTARCFHRQLEAAYGAVRAAESVLEQNYLIKRHLGFDDAFFHRGWRILREGLRRRVAGTAHSDRPPSPHPESQPAPA